MINKLDEIILKIINQLNLNNTMTNYLKEIILFLIILLSTYLIYFIIKFIVIKLIKAPFKNKKRSVTKDVLKSNIINKGFNIIPVIILLRFTKHTPLLNNYLNVILIIVLTYMSISLLFSILNLTNDLYNKHYKEAKNKPIKGILTVTKFFIIVIAVILILSKILDQSPIYLLTSLGALSAILMLIFKDAILNFVAGFQMSSNDLVRIGDWIEVSKYGADGDVVDISLNFVKVENWDKTIVTVPAYELVSNSFINWRNIFDKDIRRIKRTINIDVNSVRFLTDEEIKELSKINLLNEYLTKTSKEIKEHNKNINNSDLEINGRKLTNLGVFRHYLTNYIKNHKDIESSVLNIVRQLPSDNTGIPLEIYAFTKGSSFVFYENVASDIFDHIYAIIKDFDLKVYQKPTSEDIRKIGK